MLTGTACASRGRWKLPHLKDWRLARLLTQDELAHKSGVSRPTLSRAEQGRFVYGASVRRIARALGVKPDDLLNAPETIRRAAILRSDS